MSHHARKSTVPTASSNNRRMVRGRGVPWVGLVRVSARKGLASRAWAWLGLTCVLRWVPVDAVLLKRTGHGETFRCTECEFTGVGLDVARTAAARHDLP